MQHRLKRVVQTKRNQKGRRKSNVSVFVEPSQIQGNRIVITGSDVNHIKNVLRMKPGEEIAVSNGTDGKEYRCGIEELLEEEIICTLRFIKEDGLELPARVTFFRGCPRRTRWNLSCRSWWNSAHTGLCRWR